MDHRKWDFLIYVHTVYVANSRSGTVSVINATTNEVVKDIRVGDGPMDIDDGFGTVYVANYDSGTVSVIDSIAAKVYCPTEIR